MKTVLKIFKNDILAIVKHFFVIVIVIALGTLPSLYAWINIYANWDPYAEAGNVPVALASRDSGIDLEDGTHVNSADEVIADVKDDEDISYKPVDDAEAAIEGVRSGKYYAAIIFEDGFSYDMHHFEEAIGDREPRITCYTNIKKNAVASKLTAQAADKLIAGVNSKYVNSMLTQYFSDAGDAMEEVDQQDTAETALKQLRETRDAVHDYNTAITQIMATKGDLTEALDNAQEKLHKGRSEGKSDFERARAELKEAKASIEDVKKSIESETKKLRTAITELKETLNELEDPVDEETKAKLEERAKERTDRVLTILQEMRRILPEEPKTTAGRVAADSMDIMITDTEQIKTLLNRDSSLPEISTNLSAISQLLKDDLHPSLKLMMSDIRKALERTEPLLKSADGVLDNIDPVLGSAGSAVESMDSSLGGLQTMLAGLETKLDRIIGEVEEAKDSDKLDVLTNLLGNDAVQYSNFFTELVEVETEAMYKPDSYGAAMTPFYTIIALWVGGVMLVTLLNCTVDRRKYPKITEAQGFFGRFLIFLLIGQIQAAVVVAGDIFLLHCNPVSPGLMWLSASVTSLVFVSLIYALTLVFGDIGRAAVVVIMMIQIAGSSGTYPIEILPGIFEKIYRFFPFPYAINAMREAICGVYENDYAIYLAELLLFFVAAVVLGICVRKPFLGVKEFMAEKMRETEVM